MPPDPPRLRGLTAPCSYSRLLFSNQLPTSNFIETPANQQSVCYQLNEGLGGIWGSKINVSNGGQQKRELTNTEHVTQKTNPRAQAPEVCEKTFSTYFVPQPVENTTQYDLVFYM